uniref:propanoyl-CoA C-acyltransferase n=1 Tax=Acrobeloides nanus TaxID=290746 RepID=A0A914C2Z3_9BILA
MTKPKVYVIGVGMTKFVKPGLVAWDYPDMIKESVTEALNDCGLKYADIQQATVSYLFGGTCCGQRDRTPNNDKHVQVIKDTYGLIDAPLTCQMFGNAGREHMAKYGTKREHFAKIAYKNHLHSVNNPKSQFQKEYSLDQVLNARKIYDFVGLLECSPTSDGSAAVVLCSERYLQQNPRLRAQAVEIVGMELGTDEPSVFAEKSNIKMVGFDCIKRISERLYKNTGLTPNDVQAIELHDCFAPNELITYEAIGLCPIGKAGELVDRNDNTYGGKWVINPSGGLISKGHPIGATGVAQVVELSNQLRGRCGKRQVPNCKVGMQHNIGIGGAGVVALYRMADSTNMKSKM